MRPKYPVDKSKQFHAIDWYVSERLVRLLLGRRRDLRRRPFRSREWTHDRFVEHFSLHKLLGTIRYPGVVHAS